MFAGNCPSVPIDVSMLPKIPATPVAGPFEAFELAAQEHFGSKFGGVDYSGSAVVVSTTEIDQRALPSILGAATIKQVRHSLLELERRQAQVCTEALLDAGAAVSVYGVDISSNSVQIGLSSLGAETIAKAKAVLGDGPWTFYAQPQLQLRSGALDA